MTTHDTGAAHAPYKQLRRPTTDRMIAGVASGLGRYFDTDPTLVRVIFAVATVLTGGLAALTYPVIWFLMPQEPPNAPAWPGTAAPAPPYTGTPGTAPDGTAPAGSAPSGTAPTMLLVGDRGPI